jgi:FixJ family two-component response regulator
MSEPTVFVVDDNASLRKSLQALIQAAGLPVETYESAAEFLAAYDVKRAGCLVLDVRLRGENGLDLQDELRRRNAILPIIVMTGYADVKTTVRAFKAGAVDFVQKPVSPRKLIAQIREALEVDQRARDAEAERASVIDRVAQLTPREHQVMELLATGSSSKDIATALGLSVRTVEGHRREVLRKMDVDSAVQLARAVTGIRRP